MVDAFTRIGKSFTLFGKVSVLSKEACVALENVRDVDPAIGSVSADFGMSLIASVGGFAYCCDPVWVVGSVIEVVAFGSVGKAVAGVAGVFGVVGRHFVGWVGGRDEVGGTPWTSFKVGGGAVSSTVAVVSTAVSANVLVFGMSALVDAVCMAAETEDRTMAWRAERE